MPVDKKKTWLLHYAGPKVQSIYYNLPGSSKKSKRSAKTQYRKVVEKLTNHFAPKRNTSYERNVFRSMSQRKDERIDSFVMRLRTQANRCEFGRQIDENIKDQVTSLCWSGSLRRKILERNHKSLESVMKLSRIFESVVNQDKTFVNESKRKEDHSMKTFIDESKRKDDQPMNDDEVCNINDPKRFRKQYYNKEVECMIMMIPSNDGRNATNL